MYVAVIITITLLFIIELNIVIINGETNRQI